MAGRKVVHGYNLDADLVAKLREISSATDIPASRLANRALAAFIHDYRMGAAK